MGQSTPVGGPDLDAYEAVFAVLSKHHAGEVISTSRTLREVRRLCPECLQSDDELVRMIVMTATGQTMGVHFDRGME